MQDVLTVLASTFLVGAYLSYILAVAKGEIPHPVTIGVWVVWVILNTVTYREVASPIAQTFTLVQRFCMFTVGVLTVIATARRGWAATKRTTTFDRWDLSVGIAVLAALAYKFVIADPETSNAVAQGAVLLSFFPMAKMAFGRTQRMSVWPWSLGVAAYLCQFIVAFPDGPAALIYPIVGVIGHGTVWLGVRRWH